MCARIVQHHWRGVLSSEICRRRTATRVFVPAYAMHMVKHLELRHQFKILREAIGSGGLPTNVVGAYVTILYHLAKKKGSAQSGKAHNNMIADQKKIVGSGALVFLAPLTAKTQKREIVEMVKEIVLEIATSQGDDKIVDILICNIADRVVKELQYLMEQKIESTHPAFMSSVNLLAALSEIVLASKRRFENSSPSKVTPKTVARTMNLAAEEAVAQNTYLLKMLEECAKTYFITPFCVQTLFSALRYDRRNCALCVKILETLRLLAGSFGFALILDTLTRNGGRSIELAISCFDHRESSVVLSAVSTFYELTDHPDARKGLTTAGAIQLFLGWCDADIEAAKTPLLHVLGLIGMALLARQTKQPTSSGRLLSSLKTLPDRLDAAYDLLLDLVWDGSKDSRHAEKAATYLLSVRALPALLLFLIRVKPSCMNSPFQSIRQYNISCIVLGRFLKVPEVAQACFSEALVNHLALSLQCNRLDEIEHLVVRMSAQSRYIHRLGSKEACKALSRLSRCPSASVNAKLMPSITSATVPELPQALICDVMYSVPPYIFARPKPAAKKISKKNDMASCLMLDPLFQTSSSAATRSSLLADQGTSSRKKQNARRKNNDSRDQRQGTYTEETEGEDLFVYSQEIDRFGHCVNVKARRAKAGDTYTRSLGHISMTVPSRLFWSEKLEMITWKEQCKSEGLFINTMLKLRQKR
ncbi:hypothetical protein FI667_g1607, partial [Globisporangium splendens]